MITAYVLHEINLFSLFVRSDVQSIGGYRFLLFHGQHFPLPTKSSVNILFGASLYYLSFLWQYRNIFPRSFGTKFLLVSLDFFVICLSVLSQSLTLVLLFGTLFTYLILGLNSSFLGFSRYSIKNLINNSQIKYTLLFFFIVSLLAFPLYHLLLSNSNFSVSSISTYYSNNFNSYLQLFLSKPFGMGIGAADESSTGLQYLNDMSYVLRLLIELGN